MQSFLKDRLNMAVLIRSDNCTAIAYLNKMGSPTRSHLCLLSLEIWEWCLECHIIPHTEYLAGKDNIVADWESCHHDSSNWQLLPSVFEAINNLLGPFTIDLFASMTNAQLPVYCSWQPDPQARRVDAFSILWSQECPYIFPLQHDRQDTHKDLSGGIGGYLPDSSSLACPGMVPSVAEDVSEALIPLKQDLLPDPLNPHPLVLEGSHISDCMASLQQTYASQGFSGRATELLLQSWRANTHSSYCSAWTKWCGWCAQ